MKKKLAALLCSILCVFLLATPVYASDGGPNISITGNGAEDGEATVAGMEPVSVTEGSAGDVQTVTKVYVLPQGTDAGTLTASFEQNGTLFTLHDISELVQQGQADSKTVTQTETLESGSGEVSDIIAQAAPTLAYSENGYTGQLVLDAGAITVEENAAESYSYRVEDVREYTSLDRNDAAYVPKTVLKNGVPLQLENIEWVVMGQHPADGRMVPNLFTAVATYAGTATGSRASSYIAALPYSGTVTKNVPGTVTYIVVFHGEPVAASEAGPDSSLPVAGEPQGGGGFGSTFIMIAVALLAGACFAVAGVRIARRVRAKRGNSTDTDFDAENGYTEPAPASEADYAQEPPRQTYAADEFNIDEFFNEEGLFNG